MLRLTWRQAAAWRVRRQHLDRRAPAGSLIAVASRLCGLHAQLLSSAELSAWARVDALERGEVQRALWEERTLVKTWAMRGTLHLLPARELALWHAALGTSPRFLRPAAWQKYFGISMDQLDRLTEAIGEALAGRLLTREELGAEVARATGSAALGAKLAESSWGTLLRPAAFAGHLCFAPSSGQRVRFTHPDTWVRTPGERVDPHIATSALARRFLAVYGPATWHDLARWWNGGGVSTARQWIASLGDEVCAVDLEGEKGWMLAEHAREIRDLEPVRSVRLLPAFDPYIIAASRHARRLLPGDLRSRVYRPQGWISPVLLVNGRVDGTWRHELKGSRVEVTIEPFVDAPAWVRRAAGQEAERLAGFFGAVLKLAWKT
jgi:hypothetical protein